MLYVGIFVKDGKIAKVAKHFAYRGTSLAFDSRRGVNRCMNHSYLGSCFKLVRDEGSVLVFRQKRVWTGSIRMCGSILWMLNGRR